MNSISNTTATIVISILCCWVWISVQMMDVVQYYRQASVINSKPTTKASVRLYDDLLFTSDICQTLGMQDYFDTCAILESCTTSRMGEEEQEQLVLQEEMKNYNDATSTADFPNNNNNNLRLSSSSTSSSSSSPPNQATHGYRLPGSKYCSWPGPIMRMKSGEKHGLFLRGIDGEATNLYLHGLHIANTPHTINEQKRSVQGEENLLVYEIDLSDHMGGTHWYHSHVHDTAWQHIQDGSFGMIVIDDSDLDNVGTQDPNVLEFLHHREQILILDDSHDSMADTYVANGGEHLLQFVANEWYRLRILIVGTNSHKCQVKLSFDDDDQETDKKKNKNKPSSSSRSSSCRVHAVAHDGIYRFKVPRMESQSRFTLTTASRLDVAIQCSEDATIYLDRNAVAQIQVVMEEEGNTTTTTTNGENTITTNSINDETTTRIATETTATTTTTSISTTSTPSTATPFEGGTNTWSSNRFNYLPDLRSINDDAVHNFTIRIDETNINYINEARDKPICNDDGNDFLYNTTQEWKLNGASVHPFHVSKYPMQIVSDGCVSSGGNHHEMGEYYDVIVAPDSSMRDPCFVRLHLGDDIHPGPTTIQCNIFEHALHGAIGYFNIVVDDEKKKKKITRNKKQKSKTLQQQDLSSSSLSLYPPSCLGSCQEVLTEPESCSS